MKWSIPIGRVLGIPIRMHISFVALLAWIAWLGWKVSGLSSSLWALALINCLFACVILHELGHSLVAVRFGSEVRSVTLLPIGGVASIKSLPEKPYQELLMALAGPTVNLAIMAVLSVVRGGFPSWVGATTFPTNTGELLDALIRANLVMAAFNLVPAFPMDGGRVLRSFLALFLTYPRATAVAATMGQLLALGFILVGLVTNPFLVIIGIFVFLSAETEERSVHVKDLLRDVLAEDAMVTDFVSLQPDDTLGRCLENVYHRKQEDFPVEQDGRLVGVLSRKDWLAALHRDGSQALIRDVMRRRFVCVSPKTPLLRLYQDLAAFKQGVLPVVDGGKILGLLTVEDVSRYLMVQEANQRRGRAAAPGASGSRAPSRLTIDLG
ncbi:MAG: site-2 protease family protein [Verrucomicrobiota bacterium]